MSGRIVQFGTSRFLQAHVDLFAHEAKQSGQAVGPITVVQASNSSDRAGRVAAFGKPEGYPVIIRGIEDGAPIERRIDVLSIDRGLAAGRDWDVLSALFAGDTTHVVSNMGDSGYDVADADRDPALLSGTVPHSFPGKLTALLHHRWMAGGGAMTILPCELINRNGAVLKAAILDLALAARAPAAFARWIERDVLFADTLVDRIVSQPIEPVGAIAEPYALWAIQNQPGLVLPFSHPAIVLADDLQPFERLKLHILNLGHTVLADIWLGETRAPDEPVRAILAEAGVRSRLDAVYADEVVPGFEARGMGDEARAYVATTLDRFRNPFLDHRIADIAQNHAAKVERRIHAFLVWIGGGADAPATPYLDAVVARHRGGR